MKIEQMEEVDSKCGARQRKLKEEMHILKINPARYHGGDFEGKSIQELLNCVRNNKFSILECISDKEELVGKFKWALTQLREVSDTRVWHPSILPLSRDEKDCQYTSLSLVGVFSPDRKGHFYH